MSRPTPGTPTAVARRRDVLLLAAVLGLPLRGRADEGVDDATAGLVAARDAARAARDWARADALRAELEAAGWLVEDGADGTRIRRR